ncbi:MAG: hypothetical protein A2649_01665 [Candidatus Yanofskybacteria bacterium RIFCSPHIGHO2_01_FULL_41_26]|uniref:Four helix bundle protein n=1 Tax=Candidatus Yanofskybacteria bacterium RIFCSPHIGHO2_01_FULL_41_26 TaxID=1802661 RepID=A0A1F8EEU6_9BACT|nr:MAG: hypothetical protein A2649_01665 [Candidatus Yanofskybacteria bacterium RIFCSPHIGHO2_01_FULL_41_26]
MFKIYPSLFLQMVRSYENLDLFHLAYAFVIKLYPLVDRFPEDERKNIILQIKRAAISMPLNIAEGSSRKTDKEFLPFLSYAFGSAKELEVSLKLSADLKFLDGDIYHSLKEELNFFTGKLVGLMRYAKIARKPLTLVNGCPEQSKALLGRQ